MYFDQLAEYVEPAERMIEATKLPDGCSVIVSNGPVDHHGMCLVMIGSMEGKTPEDFRAGMVATTSAAFETEPAEVLIQQMIDTLVPRFTAVFPKLPLNPVGTRPKLLWVKDVDVLHLAIEGFVQTK